MTRADAVALANSLIEKHLTLNPRADVKNLRGWSFSLNTNKSRLGVCRYREKSIELSIYHVESGSDAAVANTILHEVAHAMVGPGYGHSWMWKSVARMIGCSGERCGTMVLPDALKRQAKFLGTCAVCAVQIPRYKASKRVTSTTSYHSACGPAGRITWAQVR